MILEKLRRLQKRLHARMGLRQLAHRMGSYVPGDGCLQLRRVGWGLVLPWVGKSRVTTGTLR